MNCIRIVFLLLASNVWISPSHAAYKISGKVNLSDQWQTQIYLAAINKLDDYYNAYPDLIIDAAHINPDGSFELIGDNLPQDKKFYRLYLMKEQNSEYDACFYGGDDHNFIHVVLDNNSEIAITNDPSHAAPFGNYNIKGDYDNEMMHSLAQLVYPSIYFYQIKFPSELRFSQEKHNRDLMSFVDTCTSTMASLAAVVNTDMDKYHQSNSAFYSSFLDRIENELPDNTYTQDYIRKVNYYQPIESKSNWKNILLGIFGLTSLILFIYNFSLRNKISQLTDKKKQSTELYQLTKKEREILGLITEGKSNKEIASSLFIELSTVKTHINKIYSKLSISERNDAIRLGKSLLS